jgi:hypothetical protein
MEELLRSNDMVLVAYIESLLRDDGIGFAVLDTNMSVLEGSLGVLPRRIMVDSDRLERARWLLDQARIDHEK